MSEAESKLNRYKSRLSNDLSDDEATGLNSHESNIRITLKLWILNGNLSIKNEF